MTRSGGSGLMVVRRALWLPPILLAVIVVTFALMHLAPGNPWERVLADSTGAATSVDSTTVRNMNVKYGLDKPLWQQLRQYLGNVARFDFGTSYQYQSKTVRELVLTSLPKTALLGGIAFGLMVPIGIGLGVLAAVRRNSAVDHVVTGLATLFASIPNFVVGILLVVLFSLGLNQVTNGRFFFPTGGFGLDERLIMPVLTLIALPLSFIIRLTRSSTLETLEQDFVRMARAKGVVERRVLLRHALKNSLFPVVTVLGPMLGFLLTGTVVVERVFNIPGLGGLFTQAISMGDYPVILATTTVYAVVFSVANLAVDLTYMFIDPRIRSA